MITCNQDVPLLCAGDDRQPGVLVALLKKHPRVPKSKILSFLYLFEWTTEDLDLNN